MRDQYLDLAREVKMLWNMRVTVIGVLGKVIKGLVRGLDNLEIGGREHPSYSIAEVGQNTKKSPGDFRRFTVIQILEKDHQLTLVRLSANASVKHFQISEIIK